MATVAFSAAARGEKQPLKAEIQAIYDHIARAVEKKDLEGVTKYSLPTATVRFAGGEELSLAKWKEQARKGLAAVKTRKSRIVVDRVERKGDVAEARYSETHETVVTDPKSEKGQRIVYKGRWRATLKKTEKGWRLSRSVELEREVRRDGKVIDSKER
jgi:ketosteroid isomerase-like protein